MATFNLSKASFPLEAFGSYELIEFHGREFYIFSDYKTVLSVIFGDFMKLPPVEDQVCKHNPVRIEFDTTIKADSIF